MTRLDMRLIIGVSGSSGVIYGIRLLQVLRDLGDVETHLIISSTAKMNVALETDWSVKDIEALATVAHPFTDITAAIASGSFSADGMLVAPCSMKTLSAIVNSYADNLLVRAADVMLKEGKKLVLVPRESPLHIGHCELLYRAAQMGIGIAPPMPAFYNHPKTVEDIVDHTVGRLLDLYGLDAGIVKRWRGANTKSRSGRR